MLAALVAGAAYAYLELRPSRFDVSVAVRGLDPGLRKEGWGVRLNGRFEKGTLRMRRTAGASEVADAAFAIAGDGDVSVGEPVEVSLTGSRLGKRGAVLTRRLDEAVPKDWRSVLAYYDERFDTWRAVPTKVSADRRTLTARVHHFSLWTDLQYGAGWLLDKRVDPPQCDGSPPDWVDSVDYLDDDNAPLRWCAGHDPKRPDLLVLKVAVNRSYGVGIRPTVKPVWLYTDLFGGGPEDWLAQIFARASEVPESVDEVFGGSIPTMGGHQVHAAFTEAQVRELAGRPLIEVSADLKNAVAGLTFTAIEKLAGDDSDSKVAAVVAIFGMAQCQFEILEPLRKRRWMDAANGAQRCLVNHADDVANIAAAALVKIFPDRSPKELGKLAGKIGGKLWQAWAIGGGFQLLTYYFDRKLISSAWTVRAFAKIRRPQPPQPPPPATPPPTQAPAEGVPSCNDFNLMSSDDQTAAIVALMESRGDNSSVSTARFSTIAFCKLNAGRSIAGIYGGVSQSQGQVTDVPSCSDFLQMDDSHADAVLDYIASERGDDSPISTRRLSAAAFCRLNPDSDVDGIYGG